MNIDEILTLVQAVSDSKLTSFKLDQGDMHISLKKEKEEASKKEEEEWYKKYVEKIRKKANGEDVPIDEEKESLRRETIAKANFESEV